MSTTSGHTTTCGTQKQTRQIHIGGAGRLEPGDEINAVGITYRVVGVDYLWSKDLIMEVEAEPLDGEGSLTLEVRVDAEIEFTR